MTRISEVAGPHEETPRGLLVRLYEKRAGRRWPALQKMAVRWVVRAGCNSPGNLLQHDILALNQPNLLDGHGSVADAGLGIGSAATAVGVGVDPSLNLHGVHAGAQVVQDEVEGVGVHGIQDELYLLRGQGALVEVDVTIAIEGNEITITINSLEIKPRL